MSSMLTMWLLEWQWDKQKKIYYSYKQLRILIVICKFDPPSWDVVKFWLIHWFIHLFILSFNIYKLFTLCKAMFFPKFTQKSTWIYCLFHFALSQLLPKGNNDEWGKGMMCLFLLSCLVPKSLWLLTIRQGLQGPLLVKTLFWKL